MTHEKRNTSDKEKESLSYYISNFGRENLSEKRLARGKRDNNKNNL